MDFTTLSLTSFAGISAAVWGVLELLKKRFKWVDGKEEYLAVGLPVLVAVGMKVAHWGFVSNMNWWQALTGALVAGLTSQVMHDKLGPGLSSGWDHILGLWSWVKGK